MFLSDTGFLRKQLEVKYFYFAEGLSTPWGSGCGRETGLAGKLI